MELLQDSAVKNTYNKCKYVVKYWEHHFKKKHGRLPSKLDIREADRETRAAYKTYFNLKSAALEQSFQDIDGFNSDEESAEVSSADLSTLSQVSVSEPCAVSNDTLENSSLDVEDVKNTNTDNTWGEHLNNANANVVAKAEEKKEEMKVNSSITQKLFKNSVFSKRNPRKSLSFSHRKSENSLNTSSKSFSQPMAPSFESANDNAVDSFESEPVINILNSNRIKITTVVEPVMTKNLSAVKSVLNENFRSERQIDPGWMKRLAQSTGTKLTNKSINENNFGLSQHLNSKNDDGSDYDSEDIIGDSDDENTHFHIAKRRKIDEYTSVPVSKPPVTLTIPIAPQTQPVVQEIQQIATPVIAAAINKCDNNEMDVDEPEEEVYKQQKSVLKMPETTRKSVRQRKTVNEIKEIDDNPFQNDEDKDPEYVPNVDKDVIYKFDEEDEEEETSSKVKKTKETKVTKEKSPKVKKERPTRGKGKKAEAKVAEEAQEEEENETYELEYSIKPRIVTVPRDTNLKNIIRKAAKAKPKKEVVELKDEETGAIVKDKNQQKIEKFQKRIETGTLNDNYVQINLKKKVYARGKKTMNFSKYKKKMWKQHKKNTTLAGPDMDMGGCDGGQLTCFTCGQVGHFAQNCKATKGDALLPMSAAEIEYCPYPTLEEASEMAKDSILAVRRPARKMDGEAEVDVEVDSSDDDDDTEEDNDEEKEDVFGDDGEDEMLLCETMKLEEYVRKIDVQQYIDESRIIKPYYELKDDGTLIDTPQEVFDVLKMFGHSSFRPGQEKAIMRILSGQSTLVTLSTGSGKSFCYQLPAYLYAKREPCISLIISPLVSLMEDQVTGIPAFLRAACLHTNKTKIQREKIIEAIKTGSLDVLLVSPEAVVAGEKSNGFGSLLRKLPPVAFACIDEAHCVSQWSHNFRPSYLMICRILKERLGITTILGLTATATRATSDSIIGHLSIPDGRLGIISDIPLPNNLRLTVSKDGNRDHALLGLLLSERFAKLRSVIVYCTRRQECERIAAFLRTSLKEEKPIEENTKKRKKVNLQAEPYHAGLAASRRRTVQNRFMSGDLRIVVATVAFGMGINKSDIRAVIHYNLPKNFESYVQEVGRAGRDGLPAHCHLFLDSLGKDENELQRHVFSDSIDRHVIRKLLQKIFIPCSCKGACPKHEVAFSVNDTVLALDLPEENIATLLCYLELHEDRYIEVLSSAYVTCKVISYGGGGNYMRKAAKDCPPLAMALAMFGDKERENESTFEFPIVDVAAAMGWDSGICKHKLKNLEWVNENNQQPRRSLLTVRFTNLGFRLLAPGNLTDTQLDEALDALYQRVCNQERTALLQLHALHETVTMVAAPSYRACIAEEISEMESKLKPCIRDYFDNPKPLSVVEMKEKPCNEDLIAADVRAMVSMYRDNTFTGRAIARIFYGIFSPNYPAVIWGRCKYWRAHINADFNAICRIATREILKMR